MKVFVNCFLVAGFCSSVSYAGTGGGSLESPQYELNSPDQLDILPPILEEASGLTDFSETEVALVQDEKAIVFVFDLKKRKVTQRIEFGKDGDYEGATRVGKAIYVLESNGSLHKIENWDSKPVTKKIALGLPTKDNEGLGFDPVSSRLLIAPKSKWEKGKKKKNLRPVFGFNLQTEKLDPDPVYVLDIDKITNYVRDNQKEMPSKVTKKGKKIERIFFRPASLAIHPNSNEIYVISAVDRTLVSFDRKGEVTNYWKLNDQRFPKPEGITFLPDGTLIISNEAGEQKPTLMQFKPRSS